MSKSKEVTKNRINDKKIKIDEVIIDNKKDPNQKLCTCCQCGGPLSQEGALIKKEKAENLKKDKIKN